MHVTCELCTWLTAWTDVNMCWSPTEDRGVPQLWMPTCVNPLLRKFEKWCRISSHVKAKSRKRDLPVLWKCFRNLRTIYLQAFRYVVQNLSIECSFNTTPSASPIMLQSAKCGTTVVLVDNCTYSVCRDGRESHIRDRRFPFSLSLCCSQWSLFELR